MGNVFTNAGDAWASAIRIHQPDRDVCKVLNNPPTPDPIPTGPKTSTGTQGQCSFNYFAHSLGLGMRYHTPVGPIRLDFSYNLNPPIYDLEFFCDNPSAFTSVWVSDSGAKQRYRADDTPPFDRVYLISSLNEAGALKMPYLPNSTSPLGTGVNASSCGTDGDALPCFSLSRQH